MKVDNTLGKEQIYQTNKHTQNNASQETVGERGTQIKDGTVFAGNLNLLQDSVAKKREDARKEAMGLISKQFKADIAIDMDIAERNNHIDEVQEENKYASREIERLETDIKRCKEEYGATDAELVDMHKQIAYWKTKIYEGDKVIREEVATIKATKEAMLSRTHDMSDVEAAAEDIMDAASDEILGMLTKEVLDKLEEEKKEEQEKAEKAKETKEEQEELIEKKQEQKKLEELNKEIASTDSVTDKEQIQRKIDEILAKQKLLQEDLKGLGVDATV